MITSGQQTQTRLTQADTALRSGLRGHQDGDTLPALGSSQLSRREETGK